MPIRHTVQLQPVTQETFCKIDYAVMAAAFAAHNELGRLFEECHHAHNMEERLLGQGYAVEREYRISVCYEDFQKDYYFDLLVDSSVPYELKTVDSLSPRHEAQTLNYLYLCNLAHGKLINFRNRSVESRFVSTSLTHQDRTNYTIDTSRWQESTATAIGPLLEGIIRDWGSYLSLEVYRDALVHFCCSEKLSNSPLSIKTENGVSGEITLNRIDEDSFLYLTARSPFLRDHEEHLIRILKLTGLRAAQWIHFDRTQISLRSIYA